jgi:hypothetical protein
MSNPVLVLVWVCTIVFVATAIVTVLALLGRIELGGKNGKNHDYYLKRLFGALILEIIGISVTVFGLVIESHAYFIDPASDDMRAAATEPKVNPDRVDWIDARMNADWSGRDYAYTSSSSPRYDIKDTALCDASKLGYVATCWEARTYGYPQNIDLTDITLGTKPARWCTYKDQRITLAVPPDGTAPPGRVYICGQSVPR